MNSSPTLKNAGNHDVMWFAAFSILSVRSYSAYSSVPQTNATNEFYSFFFYLEGCADRVFKVSDIKGRVAISCSVSETLIESIGKLKWQSSFCRMEFFVGILPVKSTVKPVKFSFPILFLCRMGNICVREQNKTILIYSAIKKLPI